ncbi:pyruvate/2-oxoglutarate dehydrogenase complex dihydrolipoamide dehydrogenase (E3) component [Breoghania corrubedonensis]|uniref:Pyruvate/2-oxoglutarate dehydrogenase complex dihydrolipoamide dehydrogenase (E3) component n=1 Tax=Breoghania corrubedonensis TaxID=665038 RepID=A0A2T5VFG7_9HYPH|nr:FAD-dependent oxidoreductase [Breoghania corrubedonensis]PTW62489.1 pyruvate/2-oxoglutarate dehydrogenase complex dihydrolipoamide dehydrogenase (E3) component [Breoghania corrubedonensis]
MTSRLLTPDICIIGAGSGGLSVAAAAAAFGVEVVLIEKGRMGGDCLNYGCVPSKSLIAVAALAHDARSGRALGLNAGEPVLDYGLTHAHIHDVIATIAPHDSVERFEALGVTVLQDHARFVDERTVEAGEVRVRARRFVIATGSSPAVPPIPGLDTVGSLTNETIFDLKTRPDHLIIIGGGPIGIELAQAYRRLGAQVSVVEAATVLAREDREAAAVVRAALRDEGVALHEATKVVRVETDEAGIAVIVEAQEGEGRLSGSHLLVAVGRTANTESLGLDVAGIDHDKRGIQVDQAMRTSNRRVYAIGDVAGGLQFTHAANYHAGLVVRAILFRLPIRNRPVLVPRVTYSDPELAHVGLSEAEARESHGDSLKVLRAPFAENDRARAEARTEGFVKLVADRRGRILGATIVGDRAGELIGLWSLAVSRRLKVSAIAGLVLPYPTLSEAGKRAAVSFYTDSLDNPWVRRLVRFLRIFG